MLGFLTKLFRRPREAPFQADGQLRQSEKRFRLAVEATPAGMVMINQDGRIVLANAQMERLFGYRAEELVGQMVEVVVPARFRDEHPAHRAGFMADPRTRGMGVGRDLYGVRKDGSEFPVEIGLNPLRTEAGLLVLATVIDISERKHAAEALRESEARKSAILETALDAIITMDGKGMIVEWNTAAEKLFGYTRAAVCRRQLLELIIPPRLRERHRQGLEHYLRTGEGPVLSRLLELPAVRADGTEFPVEVFISPIRLDGTPLFTGFLRDITERKRLEHDLLERVQELADADRRKNEFLAMLGHELRNPLAPVRNALHILQTPTASAEIAGQARAMMDRQVQHLVRLVDDLLDVSRIMRGKIELRKEPVDLAAVVARAVETAQPALDAQGHALTVSLPAEPVLVEADLIRLAQVVSNLLVNAAKYTERAGRIGVTAACEGAAAVVRVRDSGVGIDPELLPHIFDLFVQPDRSLARSRGGLGIGLTLVKRLVELHGGSARAFSEGPGKGSEFVVSLPALPAGSGAAGSSTDHGANRSPQARRRILVVDDNVDAAESAALLLRVWGHEVRTVHDGEAALAAVEAFRPEIVLLDIGLPGMDGYEVAERLRARPEHRDLILAAMTGYGQDEDRRRSAKAGIDQHLTKPLEPSALEAFVRSPRKFTSAPA